MRQTKPLNRLVGVAVLTVTVLSLNGCTWFCKPSVVYKTDTVYVTPPDALLQKATIPAPPPKDEYLNMSPEGKENALTTYGEGLLRVIKKQNAQFDFIKEYIVKYKQADATNTKSK